jgi:hypothetical protein
MQRPSPVGAGAYRESSFLVTMPPANKKRSVNRLLPRMDAARKCFRPANVFSGTRNAVFRGRIRHLYRRRDIWDSDSGEPCQCHFGPAAYSYLEKAATPIPILDTISNCKRGNPVLALHAASLPTLRKTAEGRAPLAGLSSRKSKGKGGHPGQQLR